MLLQMALFHSFYGWVVFHCLYGIYTHLYPFICWWKNVPLLKKYTLNYLRGKGAQGLWLILRWFQFSSVQSLSRVRLFVTPLIAATRPPCPSPTPGIYPNSCPSSRWCHPTISSSVIPFSSWHQFCPVSGSFPMSQFFTSGGQSVGASS